MSDWIDRQAAFEAFNHDPLKGLNYRQILESLPDAQPERKKGMWLQKSIERDGIEEWQCCQCSECGRYETRPYLYYFEEPHFCSWCGAEMRGEN